MGWIILIALWACALIGVAVELWRAPAGHQDALGFHLDEPDA